MLASSCRGFLAPFRSMTRQRAFLTAARFRPTPDNGGSGSASAGGGASSGSSRHHQRDTEFSYLVEEDAHPFMIEPNVMEDAMRILQQTNNNNINNHRTNGRAAVNGHSRRNHVLQHDPSMVEFAPSNRYANGGHATPEAASKTGDLAVKEMLASGSHYPFAMMMHQAAPFIAQHAGQTAVFHIPGEILEDEKSSNALFSDMALAYMLGMRLVIVAGCRYSTDTCDFNNPHACSNSLAVTDAETLRHCEEEAGFLRTEVERKLNRCLRVHGGCISTEDAPAPEGNVVSGNFYTASRFGRIRDQDFQYTGYTEGVHVKNIERILDSNDVVLLTTVGVSPLGELVNVNGYHLTATVAAALNAYKCIYMSNEGTVLRKKDDSDEPIQELSLSFAKSIADYYDVRVHNTGFATFERAHETLEPGAVELLLHLGWAAYALENGVTRAHVVNPGDGALLEELFTSKNGANTCLYHDEEDQEQADGLFEEDWDAFFTAASRQAAPPGSGGQANATYR